MKLLSQDYSLGLGGREAVDGVQCDLKCAAAAFPLLSIHIPTGHFTLNQAILRN
jgi:hypothetical protein